MREAADRPQADCSLLGTVVAVQANYYRVRLDRVPPVPPNLPPTLLCTRRSRLKKLGQRVMVGDRVQVEEADWQGQRGAIAAVLPRTTLIDRPPMANADHLLLVFALAEPTLDPHQLTRFLVKAESTGLPVTLALSKQDLLEPQQRTDWAQRLGQWGYVPHLFSLYAPPSLAPLALGLQNRVTIVAGPSGVGKSSLINALIPAAELRVGAVSGKLGRGRHTTRHVELFELAQGGLLADSPGFNQPELGCDPLTLGQYFPEIRQRLQQQVCQFSNCLHTDEPGCAVRGDWERYPYYQLLLQEVQIQHQALEQSRDPEAVVKRKVQRSGQVNYEPRLAQKKYRRQSRRSQRQSLQTLTGSPGEWTETESGDPDRD